MNREVIPVMRSYERADLNIHYPENPEDIPERYGLGGSSGVEAGYFEGQLFAIKTARIGKTQEEITRMCEQLIEEQLADKIYESLGFLVPQSKLYRNGEVKISKFIEGKNFGVVDFEVYDKKALVEKLHDGFVVDCLLGNWDVIGLQQDNIRVTKDGSLYRIDNGGSLRFRARGELKGSAFSKEVTEIDTLREHQELFADITHNQIQNQIKLLLTQRDVLLAIFERPEFQEYPYLDHIREMIVARLDNLEIRLKD